MFVEPSDSCMQHPRVFRTLTQLRLGLLGWAPLVVCALEHRSYGTRPHKPVGPEHQHFLSSGPAVRWLVCAPRLDVLQGHGGAQEVSAEKTVSHASRLLGQYFVLGGLR